MIDRIFIGFVCCLWGGFVSAQDSLGVYKEAIRERTDQIQGLRNSFYTVPALRPYLYKHAATPVKISYFNEQKERYNPQLGKGDQGLSFMTSSYQNNTFKDYTVWGEASYGNYKAKEVRFNETSDYDLVFPYVTSDSVGGDLSTEKYHFSGGIARTLGSWTLSAEGGYTANLSHRKVDPRPSNNSSDLDLAFGASYALSPKYVLSGNVGFRYYKQRNVLKFVSVLGRPPVVYLNGMGSFNNLLSGFSDTNDAILYELTGSEASISFVPKNNLGWFAHFGYKQYTGYRVLLASRDHSNDWTDAYMNGRFGYSGENYGFNYGFLGSLDLQTKKGTEGLFSNNGHEVGLQKIAELSTYRYYNYRYRLDLFFGKKNWSIKPYASYNPFKEQYLSPFREQMVEKINLGIKGQFMQELKSGLLGFSLNLEKENVLEKTATFGSLKQGSGLRDLLQQQYQYLSAEPFNLTAQGRYDFIVSDQIKPYVSVETQKSWTINRRFYCLNIGLVF